MVHAQRLALYNIAVCTLAIICYAALLPFIGPLRATAGFGVLGFTGFGWLYLRKRGGAVVCDERDRLIHLRSLQISLAVLWICFVAGTMFAYYAKHTDGMISVRVIPTLVFGAWLLFVLTISVSTFLLYRRS